MSKPENPPAFPVEDLRDQFGNGIVQGHHGMTLRDWFAGQALGGLMVGCFSASNVTPEQAGAMAAEVYLIADAMLVARLEPEPVRRREETA